MTLEAQAANKAALAQARKLLEAFPDMGFKKGKIVIFWEEGKATGVGVDSACAPVEGGKTS